MRIVCTTFASMATKNILVGFCELKKDPQNGQNRRDGVSARVSETISRLRLDTAGKLGKTEYQFEILLCRLKIGCFRSQKK